MARKLRVDAHIVKRACQYCDENRAGVGTGCRIRAIIATLTSRYSSNDEPNYDDEPSDSHIYLRKTGGSCSAEEPGLTVSTPQPADTHAGRALNAIYPSHRGTSSASAACFPLRCIVSADGPRCRDRAARQCGKRNSGPFAAAPADGRANCARWAPRVLRGGG